MKLIIVIAAVALGLYQFMTDREVKHPPGVLVDEIPTQTEILEKSNPLRFKDASIVKLAEYKIRARVLGKERYWLGQKAKLMPYDVAVGWKELSNSAIIDKLHISQADRFYFYRWENSSNLNPDTIRVSSANMHLIASNADIEKKISRLRAGNIITLEGQLVAVSFKDGSEIKSSLSRDDSGPGACEVMWVTSISGL